MTATTPPAAPSITSMSTSPASEQRSKLPSRREIARLGVAATALIAIMTLALGLDLSPGIDLQLGELAQADVRAPKALTYTNEIATQQAREAARVVDPQYDYTSERAITIAAEQLQAFTRRATPLDTAFAPETSAEDRQAFLETVLPDLSESARTTLMELEPDRWAPVRTEAARVLDVTLRAELKDTEVADVRTRIAAQMAGGLTSDERDLAAELIAPLLVPNSSFSETLTEQERDRQ
jgi:membrane-associated HD superfamily phosphohydrolase